MIVTPRFVFLHLHKSGGTFVNDCLLRFVPGAHEIGYHLPRALVPEPYGRLPVLGFVRSPWSYYVSWYAFQRGRQRPNALFRILSDDGRLGFEETIRNMLDLGTTGARLDALMAALPTAYSDHGLNLPGSALAPIRGSRLGFYSYLERYMHGERDAGTHLGRMERLREDLLSMMEAVGQPVSPDMGRYILHEPPRNTSEHAAYTEHYGESLRVLVAERDAGLIARHGYSFGD